MARTYRLPGSLGGHECEIVAGDGSGEVQVSAHVDGLKVPMRLPRSWLIPVEPELPPEPPTGSVVWVQPLDSDPESGIILRRYPAGWAGPGEQRPEPLDWAKVCSLSTRPPVLLVPDPAAGAEPTGEWKYTNGTTLRAEPSHIGEAGVTLTFQFEGLASSRGRRPTFLSCDQAIDVGRTLLAAARAGA